MGIKATLQRISNLLTDQQIDHALIGGLALSAFGINRATFDIDFLIDSTQKEKAKVLLSKNNFTLYHESQEVLQFEGMAQIDFLLAQRPLSIEMLKNAVLIPLLGVKIVQLEDLIGLKIQAYSNDPQREFKDKADIYSLFKVNSTSLDWEKIKKYADLFNKWAEIKEIRDKK